MSFLSGSTEFRVRFRFLFTTHCRVAAWPCSMIWTHSWVEAAPEASPGFNLFRGEKVGVVLKYRRERERSAVFLEGKWRELSYRGKIGGFFS